MVGSTRTHNRITLNIVTSLIGLRQKGCEVYSSDVRVRVKDYVFYYPDVLLSCEDFQNPYYSLEPCVIIEVMSESTAKGI
ncbi:MAG: Uma2 family endonuclease [Deinococcales bacterium]